MFAKNVYSHLYSAPNQLSKRSYSMNLNHFFFISLLSTDILRVRYGNSVFPRFVRSIYANGGIRGRGPGALLPSLRFGFFIFTPYERKSFDHFVYPPSPEKSCFRLWTFRFFFKPGNNFTNQQGKMLFIREAANKKSSFF